MILSLRLPNHVNCIINFFIIYFKQKYFEINISLHSMDISSCPLLTEEGIINFISLKPNLVKFACASNQTYITGTIKLKFY